MLSFGKRLKEIRKGAQLTQAELAEKLMVSVQSISKWECDNAMPDIVQIVPLAAILGVTTDCLLGVGGDEKADRKTLYEKTEKISKGIDPVYSRTDHAYYECYELYKQHIKKYPLDCEVKLRCAECLIRLLYYGAGSREEKDRLYDETENLLSSLIHFDQDITRVIDAKQMLVILYLYHNDFANAEEIAAGLPQRGNIKALMDIEIYSKKNDYNKCIEIAERMCNDAVHDYYRALANKARRISLLGEDRKQEAISAWYQLLGCIRYNDKISDDITIHTKWLYSALNNLANDYIAIGEIGKAFDVIEELANILIRDYKKCKESGEEAVAAEIKSNFKFYLHSCYNLCFHSDDNIISEDPRFKKCEQMLYSVD
ncbi:MAG: helix-turn-helix transcriptional regulator [Clostridiales bacterium]|nr:helix-turn-helix transcriptional regulator [Clostridiales bacterium]